MKTAQKELKDISRYAGERADYTQGGGGNTSVKEGDVMYIKASGCKLSEVSENSGFALVNCNPVRAFLSSDLSLTQDMEAMGACIIRDALLQTDGVPALRPSVEVGFHAVLKKYVIHTHSIYANLLTCAKEGADIANNLFPGDEFSFLFLPYINPGWRLSLEMKTAVDGHLKTNKRLPEVIFMQNHGIVVTSDNIDRVKALHTLVNDKIKEHFHIDTATESGLKTAQLSVVSDGVYTSQTPFLLSAIKTLPFHLDLLEQFPLYPDQLVFLNNTIRLTPQKLTLKNGQIFYNTNKSEATVLDETLTAFLFLLSTLQTHHLPISTMTQPEVDFINTWEAEKYRRSQI